ncbi:25791_t:CDS:1, partial [Gigaspora rosea]
VENVDCQDDAAAYHLFCSSFLNQVTDENNTENYGLFVFLSVFD